MYSEAGPTVFRINKLYRTWMFYASKMLLYFQYRLDGRQRNRCFERGFQWGKSRFFRRLWFGLLFRVAKKRFDLTNRSGSVNGLAYLFDSSLRNFDPSLFFRHSFGGVVESLFQLSIR